MRRKHSRRRAKRRNPIAKVLGYRGRNTRKKATVKMLRGKPDEVVFDGDTYYFYRLGNNSKTGAIAYQFKTLPPEDKRLWVSNRGKLVELD